MSMMLEWMKTSNMRDLYTKRVEVNPGDTIVHANGERWVISSELRYIFVEESTIIEATGPRVERLNMKTRIFMAKKTKKRGRR